jgi:hypothetical protein
MLKFVLCGSLLLVAGATAAPASAKDAKAATCDARYFDDLVGRGMDELRSIQGSNYRVLSVGAARGVSNPKRMTVTVNTGTRTIVAVDCG